MSDTRHLRDRWFEDIPVGEFHVFGSHTFSSEEINDFCQKYEPHPNQASPQATDSNVSAQQFASVWHICAVWMKLMVTYMERYAMGVNDGRRNGAGIGFKDLQCIKPVRAGDTLTFTYEIVEKTDKVIRDKWGVIRSRNEAFNQHGELVFSFVVDILAERRPH